MEANENGGSEAAAVFVNLSSYIKYPIQVR